MPASGPVTTIHANIAVEEVIEKRDPDADLYLGGFVKFRRFCCILGVSFFCLYGCAEVSQAQQRRDIRPIGCFVNVQSDGEHADGYAAKLWVTQSGIIGMIDYHRAIAGDPPMGVLTDVAYDIETGKLSFKAKLTTGLHHCRKHKATPSKDLLLFEGILKEGRLEGKIVVEDQSDSPPVVVDLRENILMNRDDACRLESYEGYEVWRWYWDPVFKSRGPKW